MNTRNCECANTCRACYWTPEAKVFYPGKKSGKIPLIDRMIRVCAALTNLSPSVVPFE